MSSAAKAVALPLFLFAAASGLGCVTAKAQAVPVIDVAAPIVVQTLKPHSNNQYEKFEGTVMNANIAQITVRAKGDSLTIQTFSLSEKVSAKMQEIVDRGGYQYGDKVTVYYDPATRKAMKIKGKPSKPI